MGISDRLLGLKNFAASWWYPFAVGALSCINTFTVVLSGARPCGVPRPCGAPRTVFLRAHRFNPAPSHPGALARAGPLVVLYVAGVLANGAKLQRRLTAAFANALGTTVGAALLIALIERNGVQAVTDTFPSIFASKTWERSKELIHAHGFAGTAAVCAMPIVLHPAVIFAVTAGMQRSTLLAAVLLGRMVKYTIMAQLAVGAPHLLRFFGYKPKAEAKKKAR